MLQTTGLNMACRLVLSYQQMMCRLQGCLSTDGAAASKPQWSQGSDGEATAAKVWSDSERGGLVAAAVGNLCNSHLL